MADKHFVPVVTRPSDTLACDVQGFIADSKAERVEMEGQYSQRLKQSDAFRVRPNQETEETDTAVVGTSLRLQPSSNPQSIPSGTKEELPIERSRRWNMDERDEEFLPNCAFLIQGGVGNFKKLSQGILPRTIKSRFRTGFYKFVVPQSSFKQRTYISEGPNQQLLLVAYTPLMKWQKEKSSMERLIIKALHLNSEDPRAVWIVEEECFYLEMTLHPIPAETVDPRIILEACQVLNKIYSSNAHMFSDDPRVLTNVMMKLVEEFLKSKRFKHVKKQPEADRSCRYLVLIEDEVKSRYLEIKVSTTMTFSIYFSQTQQVFCIESHNLRVFKELIAAINSKIAETGAKYVLTIKNKLKLELSVKAEDVQTETEMRINLGRYYDRIADLYSKTAPALFRLRDTLEHGSSETHHIPPPFDFKSSTHKQVCERRKPTDENMNLIKLPADGETSLRRFKEAARTNEYLGSAKVNEEVMEPNFFCYGTLCTELASHFYFKGENREKVCQNHLPSNGEKLYPIQQFSFITSPKDEAEFLERLKTLERGREYLRKVEVKVKEELILALIALEDAKIKAVEVVTQLYEAEERRTRQHFRQVEIILKDLTQELSLYVMKRENAISGLLQKIANEENVPSILRVRVFNNELELARVIGNSCSRGDLQLDKNLATLLNPTTRNIISTILLQKAQKSAATEDFIELQKALADCEECLTLRDLDDAKELRVILEKRINQKKREREAELLKIKTKDTASIKSLVNFCLLNAENQKLYGNTQEVDRWYFELTQLLVPGAQSRKAADAISAVADWFTQQGEARYKDAMRTYKQALAIYRPNFPTAIGTANTLMNLGMLYDNMNRNPEAEHSYFEALAIYKPNFSTTMNAAITFHNLAKLYTKLSRHVEAEQNYLEALHISKSYFPTAVETSTMSYNLGLFYEKLDRCVEAEQCYLEALSISKLSSPKSIETATTNFHLGIIYDMMNRYPEAEKQYMAALAIDKLSTADKAKTLLNLGVLYGNMNRDIEAEQNYLRALAIYQPNFPTDIDTAATYYNLGILYEKTNQDQKAADNYRKALSILQPNYPTAMETANTLNNMGMLYFKNERYEEGRQSCEEALAIYEPNFPKATQTANTLYNLGLYCCITDDRSQAETYLKRALAIYDSNYENPESERVIKVLVEFYEKNGDIQKLEELIALRQ